MIRLIGFLDSWIYVSYPFAQRRDQMPPLVYRNAVYLDGICCRMCSFEKDVR